MNLLKSLISASALLFCTTIIKAQSVDEVLNRGQIRGNFQIEGQIYQADSLIGAEEVPERYRTNAFLNVIYTNGGFSAGIRYESYLNELLGYPEGYGNNSGIMYRYISFTKDKLSVTVGSFYEQFGSGLTLRTYEERGLGYDNALEGIRVKYQPIKGINLTGLTGKQRLFFDYAPGIVRAFDADININELVPALAESKTRVQIGGSFVSKYQTDDNSSFVLPENVANYGGRINIHHGKVNFMAEYAKKINDPSGDNGFIYHEGEAIFLQSSYSQKGLGLIVSAKRNDNMSFRSDRNEGIQNALINYLPALTKQHTYNLLATLYPYAVQLNGELAFQADLIYKVKKGTALGGKYGMDFQVNFSSANGLDTTNLNDQTTDRIGYSSKFFSLGEAYFRDFNVTLSKKINKKFKGKLTYANLVYNQNVIEGKVDQADVFANVGVVEATYKISKKHSIRTELQALFTEQDKGDWRTLLIEYSIAPHWFFAIQDQYNVGSDKAFQEGDNIIESVSKIKFNSAYNYYNVSAGYNNGGNRISLTYGRQRAGIFCVGGVCRVVPASSGLYVSITSSF